MRRRGHDIVYRHGLHRRIRIPEDSRFRVAQRGNGYAGDPMTISKKMEHRLLLGVSPQARKLFARLRAGHWYSEYSVSTPKAMQELISAKLVRVGVRVQVISTAFVPHDHRGYKMDDCDPRREG
jgi:hypothetical protein